MFLEMSLTAVFIDVITDVDISENCDSLFIAICKSNISAMLIALFFERMIAIFDIAVAVKSLIVETSTLNCIPSWLGASHPPADTVILAHGFGNGVVMCTSTFVKRNYYFTLL